MIDKYYFDDFHDENQVLNETIEKKLNTNDSKINELINNNRLIETLKILRNNNTENLNFQQNETLKNLPTLLLDLQEALKKSNLNVLELKETMADLIKNDKKSKKRIKELEIDCDNARQQIENLNNVEFEFKNKIERLQNDEMKIRENYEELQKKLEVKTKECKSYKRKNQELESRYSYSTREIEIKEKMINEMNDMIATYKKTLSEMDLKNQKYKSNNTILKNEINTYEDKMKDINSLKDEIASLQIENTTLKNKVGEIEGENGILKQKESTYKEENKILNGKLKNLKKDLKSELNEKINILKELENLKNSQKSVFEKQETLKTIIENTANKKEEFNNIIEQLKIENQSGEIKIKQLLDENALLNEKYSQLKNKYRLLVNDFETIQNQFENINTDLSNKKVTQQEIFKMSDKFEEEIFNLKCENNLWKSGFIEIAKYKLLTIEEKNLDQIIQIDRNYINNANPLLREKVDNITSYFKALIDEQTYHANNTKTLKEALISEQEKNLYLSDQLYNEMNLRRRIHNKYMNIRGNLRIMCRIRPFIENENTSLIKKSFLDNFKISNNTITVHSETKTKKFDLDYIFGQKSTQQEVYDEVSLLVQSMQNGNNVCIIAYGQTSTGKSYTIQGPGKESPGIAVRAAKEIFEMIENTKNEKNESNLIKTLNKIEKKGSSNCNINNTKISLSIIEIYNENIYNLLLEGTPELNLYENSNGNLIIPDLSPIIINNFNEARKLFKLAHKLRKTKSTNYNDHSSRSHCIYSFHLKIVEENGNIVRSKLHILDLAGSERISKSTISDELVKKEAISINLSLTALSNVLNSLAFRQNHIPYRESKLTHFLKDSLGENFNILLLLHISPNVRDIQESVYTLDFGTRIAKICKHKTGRDKSADEKTSNRGNKTSK